jgi:hypothetical protein
MLVQKVYNKLRVLLMIYKNKNNILVFNKNEKKTPLPLQLGV